MIEYPLELVGVFDRGEPNLERVAIRANLVTELRTFFLGVGLRKDGGAFDPINDNSFWLGQGYVGPNDWIMVYTGKGTPRSSKLPNQDYSIYSMHWGRNSVLFEMDDLVPYLYALDHVRLPTDMELLIQQNRALESQN
ncbi:MAG: hypothetical protein AB3N07_01320 [Ruegeria sp.]